MKTHLQINQIVNGKITGRVACIKSLWKSSGWGTSLNLKEVTCKHCLKKGKRGIQLKLDL